MNSLILGAKFWILAADTRLMSYVPSVLASAVMIYVIKDLKPCDGDEYQPQLMTLLKVDQVCA